jgi:phosphoribosyl 1,2-cyclic phosphate phosphodiesterase
MGLVDGMTTSGRRLVFLGSGTSSGVPVLGCDCAVCHSGDPRNHRTRPSVMVELPGGRLLIDTTPELRLQMLRERYTHADAILFTHDHADHLLGLDDVRMFPKHVGGPVPVYCEALTEETIRRVFPYAATDGVPRSHSAGIPQLRFERIEPGVPFSLLGQEIVPIRLEHGRFRVLGFRFDNLAYCTDVSLIPDESWPLLEGVETLILDALRFEPHPTHFHLAAALATIARLKPRRAFLTHLSHGFDHERVEADLPEGVSLAYDGLSLPF